MERISLPINLWFAACILSAVFGTHGCASAKATDMSRTEARKEASIDFYEQNAASAEMLKADSVIIVKYDTITRENTLVKYYGIQKMKTDTVYLTRKVIETIRDTVYEKEKISEKSEDVFMKTWRIIFIIGAVAAAYFLWRGRK